MKKFFVFLCIIFIFICFILLQAPGIYAAPIEYDDYDGIVISANDNFHLNELNGNYFYFMAEDDPLEYTYFSAYGWHQSGGTGPYARGLVAGIDYYNSTFFINTYSNPYPDVQIPDTVMIDAGTPNQHLEYNTSDFWNYIFTISKYWKIYATGAREWYNEPIVFLKPYNYIEPTFDIECNPSLVSPCETSSCELKVDYHSRINSLNFKLDTGEYEISDLEAGEDFQDFQVDNGTYSLTSKDSLVDSADGKETTIMKFKVKSCASTIDTDDNIKVTDLDYSDELIESQKKALSTTVKQKRNIIDNPKTRNNIVFMISAVLFASIFIALLKNRKNVSK